MDFKEKYLKYKNKYLLLKSSKKIKTLVGGYTVKNLETRTYVNSVAFSPDGTKIVSGSDDNIIKLWDATTGACLQILEGHRAYVNSVAFSPDGTKIVSGSDDTTIKIWDVTDVTYSYCLNTLIGHRKVKSVVFSPNGNKIVSGSWDGVVKIWDVESGDCLNSLTDHTGYVNSVAFSPDGTKIGSGSDDNTIKIWDATNGDCLCTLIGHTRLVNSVAFSPDGTKIISGTDRDYTYNDEYDYELYGKIGIWDVTDVNNWICLHIYYAHTGNVISVAFSPDGTKIVSGSNDDTIKIWDVNSNSCLNTLKGHENGVNSVGFSPDGSKIVSGSYDRTIKIWDFGIPQDKKDVIKYFPINFNMLKLISKFIIKF